ncbi:MAG: DOMON domain-containing protein [Erythrobacter sp.]
MTADIRATPHGCEAQFRLEGALDRIVLPAPGPSARTDDLWKTTCVEIFWQPICGSYYREFNLSPSGRWAAYDFDAFREGMRDAPVEAISVACSHNERELVLKTSIASELPTPAQAALNAIVEHEDGELQFWALAFAPGKAEFHSEACRQVVLDRD